MEHEAVKFRAIIVVLFLGAITAACVSQPVIRPVTDTSTRLPYYGFSVLPPKGGYWYLGEDGEYGVNFAMGDPEKYKDRNDLSHTLILQVSNLEYADENGVWDVGTPEALKQATEKFLQAQSRGRFRLSRFELEPYRAQGTDCVRFNALYEEHDNPRAPGSVLIIDDQGFMCRHPDSDQRIVRATRSERYRQGETPFLDETLRLNVDQFLESIKFTDLP